MLIPYTKNHPEKRLLAMQFYTSFNGQADVLQSNSTAEINAGGSFSGFKQPGWRKVIKDKGNATTAASGSKVTVNSPYSSANMTVNYGVNNVYKYTAIGDIAGIIAQDYPISFGGSLPLSEISNLANLAFLKKCLQAQQQFSSGVFLGELRETLHLIKNPAVALRALYRDFVNRCRNRNDSHLSIRRRSRMIAETWLEYSFGVAPLLSDIEDGYNALKRLVSDRPTKYVSASYGRDYWGDVFVKNIDIIANNVISARLVRRALSYASNRVVGEVFLRRNGDGASYPEALGLRIRDFIPTIYQLIPYSFLVDYFTNIGDVIEAASFNQAELAWYCVTSISRDTCVWAIQPRRIATYAGNPVTGYSVTPSEYTYQSKVYTRSVPITLGLPSIGFRVDVGIKKALNIAALASLRTL